MFHSSFTLKYNFGPKLRCHLPRCAKNLENKGISIPAASKRSRSVLGSLWDVFEGCGIADFFLWWNREISTVFDNTPTKKPTCPFKKERSQNKENKFGHSHSYTASPMIRHWSWWVNGHSPKGFGIFVCLSYSHSSFLMNL